MMYDEEEDLWWDEKGKVFKILVETLEKIFKDTLGEKKKIFNIDLLIRQNFLSIIETEKYMETLFGQPYIYYKNEDGEYERVKWLESEIIERVMEDLGLEEKDLYEFS